MPDDSYGNTVGALDELRKKQIEKKKKEASDIAEAAYDLKKGNIPMPGVRIPTPERALIRHVGGEILGKDISPEETQLAKLETMSQGISSRLKDLHSQIKTEMAGGKDDEVLDPLIEKAVMLRKKLEYLHDVGSEIEQGSPMVVSNPFLRRQEPYSEIRGDIAAAKKFREEKP